MHLCWRFPIFSNILSVLYRNAQERYSRKTEAADLQRAFTILDSKGDGKIDAAELGALFKRLGHKFTNAEIESIIWEADTDCDRCLTWKEFQEMYDRCRNDQTGGCHPQDL